MTIIVNGLLHGDTQNVEELSELALLACDASYKGRFAQTGEALRPFDDTPQYGNPQPSFGTEFSLFSTNYVVDRTFEDSADLTGFKAIAYKDAATNDLILAFAGTDGPNVKDWWGNIFHVGWNQWAENSNQIREYLQQFVDPDTKALSVRIHFAGQSLGGALAQFAAYDFVSRNGTDPTSSFDKSKLSLVTFNALGAVAALSENQEGGFSSALLNGLGVGVHYVVENDIVHRLGNGHVGGQVKKFSWTDANATPGSAFNRLDPIDAHRIEGAFYRYLNPARNFFKEATSATTEYLALPTLQKLASAFGNLERKTQVNSSEAAFQLIAGLIPASLQAPEDEVNGLVRTLLATYRDAGKISPLKAEVLFDTNWSALFRAVASNNPNAAAATYSGSIVLGGIASAFGQSLTTARGAVQSEFGSFSPPNMGERSFDTWEAQARLLIEPGTSGTPLARDFIDAEELAKRMHSGQSWLTDVMVYVVGAAANAGLVGVALGTFAVQAATQALATVGEVARKLGSDVAEYQGQMSAFVKEFAQAIANSSSDYLNDAASALSLPQTVYLEAKALADGFLSSIKETGLLSLFVSNAQASEEVTEAGALARKALQAVVIRPVTSGNPFDSPSFDPDGSPTGTLKESQVATHTVYLPYEAGAGSQRIRLTLEGVNADRFAIFSNGEEIASAGGAFEISVPEGRRHVSFALVADEEFDQSGTLSISATLVDAEGVRTHETHVEANLTVTHEEQPPFEVVVNGDIQLDPTLNGYEAPPQTTFNEPTKRRTRLVGGAAAEWVVSSHATQEVDAGGGSNLIFEDVAQGLSTDPFREADSITAGDGNDLIFGNLGGSTIGTGDGDNLVKPYTGPGLWVGHVLAGQPETHIPASFGIPSYYADLASAITIEKASEAPTSRDDGELDLPFRFVFKEASGTSQFFKFVADPNTGSTRFATAHEDEQAPFSHYTIAPNADGSATLQYFGGNAPVELRAVLFPELRGDFLPQYRAVAVGPWVIRPLSNGSVELKYQQFQLPAILPGFDRVEEFITPEAVEPLNIEAGIGEDHLFGGEGEDVIRAGGGDDRIAGYEGDDTLLGGSGDDLVIAGTGDDYVDAGSGADRVWGEGGSDVLIGGDGSDVLTGDSDTAPVATQGDDFLDGGGGDDVLTGNGGHDEIYGGDGDDQLAGDEGDDYLDGESGSDRLSAGSGNNTLYGGAGDDQLDAADGQDYLDGEGGDDVLIAGAGDDTLQGGEGNDNLTGDIGNDLLDGDSGDDTLAGGDGDDSLFGGGGSDQLTGGEGSDLLDGGAGSDLLAGGEGNDVYRFERGAGTDAINDASGPSVVEFQSGILPAGLGAQFDGTSFELQYAGADHLQISLVGTNLVDYHFRFADGTQWTTQELLEEALPAPVQLIAGDTDTALFGSRFDDVLVGGAGDDVLQAGAGNDILAAGGGDDSLNGGAGDDTYRFGLGDGADRIVDLSGSNTLEFGVGITSEMLTLRSGSLQINIGDSGDAVHLESFDAADPAAGADVESFRFADGATLSLVELLARGYVPGPQPFLFTPGMGERSIGRRALISEIRVAPPFLREDIRYERNGTALVISAGLSDSLLIADWFTNSGAHRPGVLIESHDTFIDGTSITAGLLEVHGSPVSEALVGLDGFGDLLFGEGGDDRLLGLSGDDQLFGGDGNDVVDGGAGWDFLFGEGGAGALLGGSEDDYLSNSPGFGFFAGGPGSDFIEIEQNPRTIVALRTGDGADQVSGFAGGTLSIGGGVSPHDLALSRDGDDLVLATHADDSLRLLAWFAGEPDPKPAVNLQLFGEDGVRTYDFTAFAEGVAIEDALIDISADHAIGGAIAYQYAVAGNIDALTTTQAQAVLGDPAFGQGAQAFNLASANNSPVLNNPIDDQTANEDSSFALQIPLDAFFDSDAGDTLVYAPTLENGSALPDWLSFTGQTLAGTPLQADVGAINVRVTATDSGGLSASNSFTLTVINVNDAPVVAVPLADRTVDAGSPFVFSVPAGTFADDDPDESLSLSAALSGVGALPAWLAFDPGSGTFSSTLQAAPIGISHVAVTATDVAGESTIADFGLIVRAAAGATVAGSASDDLLYGGSGNETLKAKGGNDYLYGDAGNDLLRGGAGSDILQGGEGDDTLRGGAGQNILEGGAGDDVIYGGQGSSFLAGGPGNDVLRVGQGNDLIAFNLGDGVDTVYGGRDSGNTLSFGGGIGYDDLNFSKDGKDLVVNVGAADRVVLKNWYNGNKSVLNLQLVHDAAAEFDAASGDPLYSKKVQTFDFLGMVSAFDTARAASPGLTSWALTNALLQWHLSHSDEEAIGGDLAYWYGKNRGLSGISIQAAQEAVGASGFGADAQTLRPFAGLQEGFAKLV